MDGGSLLVSRIAYVVLHIENSVQRIVKEIKIVVPVVWVGESI